MSEQQSKSTEKRIWMILEDDYPLRFMLESMFRLWNSEPLSFANGYDASSWLDQIEAGTMKDPLPEVALLDIRVPGPQGPEIAERMHRMPQTAHIPVVIMTAYRLDMVEKDKIAAQAQPDDFVNKGSPIFDTLQEVLEGAIKKAKDRHAMTTAKTITSEAKPKEAPPINKPASDDGSPKPDGAKAVKAEESGTAAKSVTEPKSSKKSPAPASSGKKRDKASSKSTGKPASSKTSKSSPGKSEGR